MKNSKIINISKVVSVLLVFILGLAMVLSVKAGDYENEKDVLTRLKASTLSSHDITFNLSAGTQFASTTTITIDFGEDSSLFAVDGQNSTSTDFDFNDGTERTIYSVSTSTPGGNCSDSVGANDVAVGINDTTGIVTFLACNAFTSSAAAATVNIQYGTAASGGTNRVTNPAAGNNKIIYLAGTVGDAGSMAISIISDDQVVVTATVEPSFTFTISSSTCALGTLSTTATSSCSYTATSTSNSVDGYVTTILANDNLKYGTYDIDNVADGAVTATFEEYGIGLTGTDRAFADNQAISSSTAQTIASDATGPIASQGIIITHIAAISATTVAGSYTQTVTLISTGTY